MTGSPFKQLRRTRTAWLALPLACSLGSTGLARDRAVPRLRLDAPQHLAATRREPDLARCIASAADGRNWLEATLWAIRDQESGWVGAAQKNPDGSEDLGPMQVNSRWVPVLARLLKQPESRIGYWLQFDACFNVSAAKWILLGNLRQASYWSAVGAYNSSTEPHQRRYIDHIAGRLATRFGARADSGSRVTQVSQTQPK